ncbi:MAG TPA: phosphatidylglycerol lysyltransferase domain-containing protein, partial [Longimicrobiales bacterium]|nr:phosphatidylglycerol lysyltransferase domain-containing protein [Longimicrobiales bacterium]
MLLAVVAAIVIVHEQLGAHSFRDIVHEINAIPLRYMWLALLFTAGGYAVLATFDYLALKSTNPDLTFTRTAFASLIAFVRYRTFSSWPIPIATHARSVAFSTSSFWLGAAMVAGLGMIVSSDTLGHMLHVPEWVALVVGGVLLGGLAVYLYGRRAHPWLAISQLIASTTDWLLASAVLYAVLPHEIRFTFLAMASAFVIAQAVGMISHVPGGFGVFEATLLILLQNHEPSPTVLAALVAYRIVYYLIPFFIATVSLLIYETLQRQKGIMQVARVAGVWVPAAIPQALAAATFIAGTILLISGATPRASGRLAWLNHVIPLSVIEISHFAGSLIGVGLILLAWGLTRRLSGAFHIAVLLIALGIPASLLKGIDYEEATVLAILLITMIPARKHFYRHSSLTAEMMTPGWMAAIVAVLAAVTWLGFFSFKHVQYREDIWWRFALRGDAPRFMRATVGVVAVTAAFAIRRLVRAAPPSPEPPTRADLERARAIGHTSDDSASALALLGDKRLLFDDENKGFLMYGVAGRSWVALHDPFGDDDTQRELAWRFHEMVDKHGGWTVFYEVGRERLDLYLDLGL